MDKLDKMLMALSKEKTNPKNGLKLCEKILLLLKNVHERTPGENPNPFRLPKEGSRGELWYRNRLLWLRTIPLEEDTSFIITHSEAAVYRKGKNYRNSADLLGIWRKGKNTKLGIVELKAGKNGEKILYAIMEGTRNAYLHHKAKRRLNKGWDDRVINPKKETKESGFWKTVWKRNPYPINKLKDTQVIVIGDSMWRDVQTGVWREEAIKIIENIKTTLDIEISVYSLNEKGKDNSSPYCLLPLKKVEL